MVLLKNFFNMFFIPELRKRLFFTVGVVLVIHRLGNYIPIIGIDIEKLKYFMNQPSALGGIFSYFDLVSGGNLRQCTLFALGIQPYITASIVMQLLTLSWPSLELLVKEGEYGRKLVNQYTRYLAIFVSLIQGIGFSFVVERYELALDPGWQFRVLFLLSVMVGSFFVMWLGEQISLFGLGNGSSMIIFAGIVSRFPDDVIRTLGAVFEGYMSVFTAIILFSIVLFIIGCIVFLEKGERKIPVQYSRRMVGNRFFAGQSTYIPFKINTAGVMPVILSQVFVSIPIYISSFLGSYFTFFKWMSDILVPGGLLHSILNFVSIIIFTFVYTAIQFNPEELADNIKKSGGFLPGIRPGRKTADFFNFILTRIGLAGAMYLAFLALLPNIVRVVLDIPFYLTGILSGTGLLIVVGVAMDMAAQIESYLIEHKYEGFLVSGKIKNNTMRN